LRIVEQNFEIFAQPYIDMLNIVERAYRICYKSDFTHDEWQKENFIKSKIAAGHLSPLEHVVISVQVTTNRAIANEIVRHRIGSYSQESTRYCNYSKDKFSNEIRVIQPYFTDDLLTDDWKETCRMSEERYFDLLARGARPEQARDVLPLSLATDILITYNLRQWRHFFELRALGTTGKPHPQIKELAANILAVFAKNYPIFFDDLTKGE